MCAARELPYHSRFQVVCDGTPAWATDARGAVYRFDGLVFSRRRLRDRTFHLVPSWQTPPYGWLHPSECPCGVWGSAPLPAPAGHPARAPAGPPAPRAEPGRLTGAGPGRPLSGSLHPAD